MRITLGKHELYIEVHIGFIPAEVKARRDMARRVLEEVNKCIANNVNGYFKDGKIERIKAYRWLTNAGLVESKDWVEAAFTGNGSGDIA